MCRKEEKVMKKKFLVMLMAAMTMTYVVGCAKSGENSGVENESQTSDGGVQHVQESENKLESGKVELKVWAEETHFDMMNQMIESFKQEYAGQAEFDIVLEALSDGDVRNALLGDVHNGADVFSMPDDQLYAMISGGAISPVENPDKVKSDNVEEAVVAASYNDIIYAYPLTADNGYFLYYDKKYFSDADVATLDNILKICEENEKKISMELNSGWYLYSFFGQTGLEFGINDDNVTNYCSWNATEGEIKGVDVAQAIIDVVGSPGFISQGDGDFIEVAKSGEVIAGISGTWNAMAIREIWGDNYGACKLPTYTCAGKQIQMASFTGYKMIGVNAYSDHLQWAHKLAQWISNEENQKIRFVQLNQGPSNINAAASDEVRKVPAIAAILEQSQYGTLQRVGNNYWEACTSFADIIIAGNPSGIPLQQMMDDLVNSITSSTVH